MDCVSAENLAYKVADVSAMSKGFLMVWWWVAWMEL